MNIDEELEKWQKTLPREITSDPLWSCTAYRLATFACDFFWDDLTRLLADRRTADVADQLARSLRGIGSAYTEGYSRLSPRDRCRFYEYSLGSARESRDWALKGRRILGDDRALPLMEILSRIVQLLIVTIARERRGTGGSGGRGEKRA